MAGSPEHVAESAVSRRRVVVVVLALVAAACAGVALWGMHDLVTAKRCLDGALYRDRFNGAAIVPDACVIATSTGSPIRVALNGPSFVGTLIATAGTFVAAIATFVAVRRTRRVDAVMDLRNGP